MFSAEVAGTTLQDPTGSKGRPSMRGPHKALPIAGGVTETEVPLTAERALAMERTRPKGGIYVINLEAVTRGAAK